MWYDNLFRELESKKNENKAIKMSAYMKNQFQFLGIPKPEVDKITKPYIKTASKESTVDWDFIFLCWEKDYREAQYVGVEYIYAVQNILNDSDLEKLRHLIVTKPWWDITDGLDKVIGNLSIKYHSVNNEMLEWSKSDNIWLRRVAIDFQQKFKEKTDIELLEKIICNNFATHEFFIDKAIGWSLREYSKVNPEWVTGFIEKHKDTLSKLSIREASKYL